MTTFDDRERAFENLFAHDQELAFKAQARRNRAIGLWAAAHSSANRGRSGSLRGRNPHAIHRERRSDAVVARIGRISRRMA